MYNAMDEAFEKRSRNFVIRLWDRGTCRNIDDLAYCFSKSVEEIKEIVGTERLAQVAE